MPGIKQYSEFTQSDPRGRNGRDEAEGGSAAGSSLSLALGEGNTTWPWALGAAAFTAVCASLAVDLDFVFFSLAPLGMFLAGLLLTPRAALLSQLLYLGWTGVYWGSALGTSGLLRPEVAHAVGFCAAVRFICAGKESASLSGLGRGIVAVGGLGFVGLAIWLMGRYPHLAMVLFAAVVVALMVYFGKAALRYRFWLMTAAIFCVHLVSVPLLLLARSIAGQPDLETTLLFGVAVHVPGQLLMGLIATRLTYDVNRAYQLRRGPDKVDD